MRNQQNLGNRRDIYIEISAHGGLGAFSDYRCGIVVVCRGMLAVRMSPMYRLAHHILPI